MMGRMAKGVSPEEETTGKLTAAYFAYVSVEDESHIAEAAKGLEAPLRRAVEESPPDGPGARWCRR